MKIPPADLSRSYPQADASRAERSPDVSRPGREKSPYQQSTQHEGRSAGRWWLLLGALVYSVFVVYGSLVPLRFQAVPFDQALENFRSIRYLQLGIASRADWVANILLFIPLGFLWTGVAWPQRHLFWRAVVSVMVLLAACGLSLSIEFIQQYFPPRTVSLNDIIAETAGATIGISAWWALGRPMLSWLQALPLVRGTANTAQRLLVVYLVVLFGYNLMPLDLTISPVELYRKWREGKVIFLPFATPYADNAQRIYDLITDIAIWIPAAVLWRLAFHKSRMQTWLSSVIAAGVLELLQLFVYSRVSDSTDVFTAALGAAIGVTLARSTPLASSHHTTRTSASGALRWALGVACWMMVLAAVFWYPFDFNLDRSFLRDRLAGLQRVPFEAYYFGTEFRALTEVLRKSLFVAPLGFLLYRLGCHLPPTWPRGVVHGSLLLVIFTCAVTIEAGQIALPSKNADFTDGVLEFIGGALGYFGSLLVAERLQTPTSGAQRRG